MVGYKYAELYKQDSVDKQLKIEYDGGIITNEDLYSEEFELTESLCSDTELKFGKCEASSVKFKVANIFSPMIGKQVTISETLAGNTDEPFRIGTYKVYSDVPTADRRYREVTACDAMYDIINSDVAEWYNSLLPDEDSTVTLKEFRTSFVAHFGLEQEEIDLVNDDMVVEKTIEPSELSGKDVITAICEINGCFGHIGRNGQFKYILLPKYIQGLYPSDTLYPSNDLFPRNPNTEKINNSLYISCQYEDYVTKDITKLQIRQKENDIGAIVGDGDNCYVVEDNFLVYGKGADELDTIAQNLFSVISEVHFRPFSADCKGNPCLEVGDAVRLSTKYEIVESYILKRTLKGIQALRDTYESQGKQEYSERVNSLRKSIIQLKGKTNELERTVEETKSTITDVESGLQSRITQTAKGFTTEIKKQVDETKKYAKNAADTAESNAKGDTDEKLKAYTTTTEMRMEIDESAEGVKRTVAQSNTKWYAGDYWHDVNYVGYGTPVEAGYGDIDTYRGKTYLDITTGYIYYCCADDGSYEQWFKDYECPQITDTLQSRITQTAKSIETEVERAKKEEGTLSSRITQTAESIETEVSRAKDKEESLSSRIEQTAESIETKVSKDKVISTINQSAEEVAISADKINFNGAVTANENFKIKTDGSMEALAGIIGDWEIYNGYLRFVVGENAQAFVRHDEILISRTAGANVHMYPGLLYMQSDNGERSISINCNDGSINLGGDWSTPWGDVSN